MNKVFALPPGENWIVDRFVAEWVIDNQDIAVNDPEQSDVIWCMADWCWARIPIDLLSSKKVVVTVHHIVPEKFGFAERRDFDARDRFTDAYIVPNKYTYNLVRNLTMKPIELIPYWANASIYKPSITGECLRTKHQLPTSSFLIGSFQRDTEGHDLKSPKLEKGPDLLADAIITLREKMFASAVPIHVVLGGWRRQYIMGRLDEAGINYSYFERPSTSTIVELYQTLNLYPVTSRHEGGPQSLIECGLLNVPVVSRPVGIAEQVLPRYAIHDDVTQALGAIPNVKSLITPMGYKPYRDFFEAL